jgi:CHAT domain-containing protein
MSLWQVPDKETVEFMTLFYKNLIENRSVRDSFNSAQLQMSEKYDPYFWGAFVLIE